MCQVAKARHVHSFIQPLLWARHCAWLCKLAVNDTNKALLWWGLQTRRGTDNKTIINTSVQNLIKSVVSGKKMKPDKGRDSVVGVER